MSPGNELILGRIFLEPHEKARHVPFGVVENRIVAGFATHAFEVPHVVADVKTGFSGGLARRGEAGFGHGMSIHGVALALCLAILVGDVHEKGEQGGWVTIVVTALVVAPCFVIRGHCRRVQTNLRRLNEIMNALPPTSATTCSSPWGSSTRRP